MRLTFWFGKFEFDKGFEVGKGLRFVISEFLIGKEFERCWIED